MKYFRLYEDIPSRTALGFGPGGTRWNHRGVPMIYLSNYSSIAINEILSIKGALVTKSTWILSTFEIQGEIQVFDLALLPEDWNSRPPGRTTKDIGTIFTRDLSSVCLRVPSARLNLSAFPEEHNLLVNPLHPNFSKEVVYQSSEPFNFQINDLSNL